MKASGKEVDERLLVEAAQRDPTRFAELYEAHFERVYAYMARRVGMREDAEDLTADVFQRALAGLPRFEFRGVPFAAWLLKIGGNLIADRMKRLAREHESQSLGSNVDDPADSSLEEVERRARLFRLVDQLPVNQRHVILLRFAEEKSIREIAQELGRTEGAVKQLQFRALENLRARMSESHG